MIRRWLAKAARPRPSFAVGRWPFSARPLTAEVAVCLLSIEALVGSVERGLGAVAPGMDPASRAACLDLCRAAWTPLVRARDAAGDAFGVEDLLRALDSRAGESRALEHAIPAVRRVLDLLRLADGGTVEVPRGDIGMHVLQGDVPWADLDRQAGASKGGEGCR